MSELRVPSPARSQGTISSLRLHKSRTRSVRSVTPNSSVRLTAVIPELFTLSPLPNRQSVLNDDTHIEVPGRNSWWKRLSNISRDVTDIIEEAPKDDNVKIIKVAEKFDVEIISQEKENLSLDLPDSSDGESIHSIIIPQRRLFANQGIRPQKQFAEAVTNKDIFSKTQKSFFEQDRDIDVRPKKLFNQASKPKTKPVFTPALLNISANKTLNKTTEKPNPEQKGQVRILFGNKPSTKRKDIYADFVVSDSDDEVPEIQSDVFGFQMKTQNRPQKSSASHFLDHSSASNSTDIEIDDWQHLPSSTMVESELDEPETSSSLKRIRLRPSSKSEISGGKLRTNRLDKSNNLLNSETEGRINTNASNNLKVNNTQTLNTSKNYRMNISGNNKSSKKSSLIDSSKVLQNGPMDKTLTQENMQVINIVDQNNQNTLEHLQNEDNDDDENLTLENYNEDEQIFGNNTVLDSKVNKSTSNKASSIMNKEKNDTVIQKKTDPQQQSASTGISFGLDQNERDPKTMENQEVQQKILSQEKNKSVIENHVLQEVDLPKEVDIENEVNDIINTDQNEQEYNNGNYKVVHSTGSERNINEKINHENNPGMRREKEEQINRKENNRDEIVLKLNVDRQSSLTENKCDSGERQKEAQCTQDQNDKDEDCPAIDQGEEKIDQENEINEESQGIEDAQLDTENEEESHMGQEEISQSNQEDKDNDINENLECNNIQVNDDEVQSESDSEQNEYEMEDEQQSENDERSESGEHVNEEDCERVSDNEIENDDGDVNVDSEERSPNLTRGSTGRYRNRDEPATKSPETVLYGKTNREESFKAHARNTSIRSKTLIKQLNVRASLAPARESTGFSDGTINSSAEGSGWDSHRTTRKTMRQTFGREFTPRKSLRTLVMERAAKRQTNINEAVANKSKRKTNFNDIASETMKMPLANSTELPEFESYEEPDPIEDDETVEESDHEASRLMRQTTLETYLLKIKQENAERRLKMQEEVMKSLKRPAREMFNAFKMPEIPKAKRPAPRTNKQPSKRNVKAKSSLFPTGTLPAELLEDMKYRPPKRFHGNNAPWITKRLYKYLEDKLKPKYDYRARIRAERLVETLHAFVKEVRRRSSAAPENVATLQHEMARMGVVQTYFDFYNFFHEFMPREITIRVNPDILNKLPVPRNVFGDIIPELNS